MSELTAYNSERIYWAVEQVEREVCDLDTLHLDDNLFYLKSEADKVIAELLNESDVYKAKYEQEYDIAVHNEKQLSAMRIEIRHHKYKRCLAMANLCHWKSAVFIYKKDKNDFYWRWYKRWLKIAKQFKEAK